MFSGQTVRLILFRSPGRSGRNPSGERRWRRFKVRQTV